MFSGYTATWYKNELSLVQLHSYLGFSIIIIIIIINNKGTVVKLSANDAKIEKNGGGIDVAFRWDL